MTGYSRQRFYTDGDTALAAHTNDEFDRLVEVFNRVNGHSHDGSAGQGSYIGVLSDKDNDTRVHVEFSGDEDVVRMFVNGTERFVLDATNMQVKKPDTESTLTVNDLLTELSVSGSVEITFGDEYVLSLDGANGSMTLIKRGDPDDFTIFSVTEEGFFFDTPDHNSFQLLGDTFSFFGENAASDVGPTVSINTAGVNFRFGEDFDKFITFNEFGIFRDGVPIGVLLPIDSALTVDIGPSGDYVTINSAITDLSRRYPVYTNPQTKITMRLMDDFVLAEQVIVDGLDLSNMVITKLTPSGTTSVTRSALTTSAPVLNDINTGLTSQNPIFCAINGGVLPTLNSIRLNFTPTNSTGTQGFPVVMTSGKGSRAVLVGNCFFTNTGALAHATQDSNITIVGTGKGSNNWMDVGSPSAFFTWIRSSQGGEVCMHDVRMVADVTADSNNLIYASLGKLSIYDSYFNSQNAWNVVAISSEFTFHNVDLRRATTSTRTSLSCTNGTRGVVNVGNITDTNGINQVGDSTISSGSVVRYTTVTGNQNITPNQVTTDGILFRTL